jgi:hypothetical protein
MNKVRARGQILPMVVVVVVVMFTLVSAAANLIPVKRPTAAELRAEELQTVVEQRRARIAALSPDAERCQPATAHELARLLAFDGRWADVRAYADRYEARCGGDLVVRHWGHRGHA